MVEVILLEKVANLGNLGDIVKTRPGYARNYLIPGGKARRATAENKKYFEERRAELEKLQIEKLSGAEKIAAKVNGMMVLLSRKAGVDGRLFGSVSNTDIAEALVKQGVEGVKKAMILMPEGPIKTVGDFKYKVHVHTDVEADIIVSVSGEHN